MKSTARYSSTLLLLAGALWLVASAASADTAQPGNPDTVGDAGLDGVARAEAQVATQLRLGHIEAARSTVRSLASGIPPRTVGVNRAWRIGLMHVQVGLEKQSRPWFVHIDEIAAARREKAGPLATGAHAPELAERLAAALHALGRREQAVDVLRACNKHRPRGAEPCQPWLMAEVAAARGDWPDVAQVIDPWLNEEARAPASALLLRLRAAMEAGDEAAIGRFRAALIRAGGQLPETPQDAAEMASSKADESLSTGALLGGIALLLLLLGAGWLAWRVNRSGD